MALNTDSVATDDFTTLSNDVVQLSKLLLGSDNSRAVPFVRKLARKYRSSRPELASDLVDLLRASPLRSVGSVAAPALPVDGDSRLPLVREEDPVLLPTTPIFDEELRVVLDQIVDERLARDRLLDAGLAPTRTALFTGPPGVGKTLAARWVADRLGLPLIILDLASVMSSFLGRTGVNVKRVLEYARNKECVLLLDEIDAVAKRRDDATELGELKRLVTVLLQEIDGWPEGSLLIAATNHADLLDPAVWRRFEVIAEFRLPGEPAIEQAIRAFTDASILDVDLLRTLSTIYVGDSFSDIEQRVMRSRRRAALSGRPVLEELVSLTSDRFGQMNRSARVAAAVQLLDLTNASQRQVSEITGVSRDTLRKHSGSDGQSRKASVQRSRNA